VNLTEDSTHPTGIMLWLMAIRPKTLPAAVGPIAVGSGCAYAAGGFSIVPAVACLVGAVLLQIGVNLANDYFDAQRGIDSDERLGPTRVTQSGLMSGTQVRSGIIVTLGGAGLIFLYLGFLGGWPIVLVGAASVLAALGYSGGPYPLASHGLGDLFVFIFFGLVAVGATFYIQTGYLSYVALIASIPPGLLITAILVVNNLRDIDTDATAGKRTLAVMIGRRRTILQYLALVWGSYLVAAVMLFFEGVGWPVLAPLVTAPMAWSVSRRVGTISGRDLNELLAKTAQLSLFFSLLFAAGLAWG
jgi:1,4-dihydroxy-2-naphthoate octaprenyltransferase